MKTSVMIEGKESVIFPRSFFVLFIYNGSLRCLFDTYLGCFLHTVGNG